MRATLAFLFLTFASAVLASAPVPQLGPVKQCQCYTHLQSNIHTVYGTAELCHCRQDVPRRSIVNRLSTARQTFSGSRNLFPRVHAHQWFSSFARADDQTPEAPPAEAPPAEAPPAEAPPAEAPPAEEPPVEVSAPKQQCTATGPDLTGTLIADDFAELQICGIEKWRASLNNPASYSINIKSYSCGDFFFSLRNDMFSSGLTFVIKVNGETYGAVGADSPALPADVKPLKAFAQWTFGSCFGVFPNTPAVYISSLDNEPTFASVAKNTGVFPIGVQNGDVFPGGLQCIRVENPTC